MNVKRKALIQRHIAGDAIICGEELIIPYLNNTALLILPCDSNIAVNVTSTPPAYLAHCFESFSNLFADLTTCSASSQICGMDIKIFNALEHKKYHRDFLVPVGNAYYNGDYMLQMLRALGTHKDAAHFGDGVTIYHTVPQDERQPCMFKSEIGYGFLLPRRKPQSQGTAMITIGI